jgi:hypothetical protein
MKAPQPHKANLPYAVIRVDPDCAASGFVERVAVVLSLFDDRQSAMEDAARLQRLNDGKNVYYIVQRVKKYFRNS